MITIKRFFDTLSPNETVKHKCFNYFAESCYHNNGQNLVYTGKFSIYSIYKKKRRWWRGRDKKKSQLQNFTFKIDICPKVHTDFQFFRDSIEIPVFVSSSMQFEFPKNEDLFDLISERILKQLVDLSFIWNE